MVGLFAKRLPWWCGVDVTDEDGQVRRGLICHKAPNGQGLFVDFGYRGHNFDFVPLDQCTNRSITLTEDYSIGGAVQVVYQTAPDHPWRWYPATFLAGVRDRFAFVAIHTGETVVETVVPVDGVRIGNELELSGSDIRHYFFEHEVDIPQSEKLGQLASRLLQRFAEAKFLELWHRNTQTVGRKLEGGRLYYNATAFKPFTADIMEFFFNQTAAEYLSLEAVSSADAVHPDSMDNVGNLGSVDGLILAQLPRHFMYEIFSCLRPIQQVPCRKVCRLWNFVLTCNASTSRVEIDVTNREYHHYSYHQLAMRLHTTITDATGMLILSGGPSVELLPTFDHLETIKTMLKAMKRRIRYIVLHKASVMAYDLLDSWYEVDWNADHIKWRDVCDTLLLNEVEVWLPLNEGIPAIVRQEALNVQVDVGMENVLEKWCPEVSGPDREELEETLRLLWVRDEDSMTRTDLWRLLCRYQSGDKRFPPCNFGDSPPIPAGTLGVPPLASLRKSTVCALYGTYGDPPEL